MSKELFQDTHPKEYELARGVNVKVDDVNANRSYTDHSTDSGKAADILKYESSSAREAGRSDILRTLKENYDRDPKSVSKRHRVGFKIGDWLEKKDAIDLIEDLLEPRPTYDDKRSYWGRGPYKHMTREQRHAYRRSRGYEH